MNEALVTEMFPADCPVADGQPGYRWVVRGRGRSLSGWAASEIGAKTARLRAVEILSRCNIAPAGWQPATVFSQRRRSDNGE